MITAETVGTYPTSLSGQLNLRTATSGPEYELVLEYVAAHLPKAPRGQARTLFLEPEIESGFPGGSHEGRRADRPLPGDDGNG
jgi:hypothetical protein